MRGLNIIGLMRNFYKAARQCPSDDKLARLAPIILPAEYRHPSPCQVGTKIFIRGSSKSSKFIRKQTCYFYVKLYANLQSPIRSRFGPIWYMYVVVG